LNDGSFERGELNMKQQIRFFIRMVRTYPRYAAMAVALDASIGIIVAVTTYVVLYSADVGPSTMGVLFFSAVLAIAGILGVGYTLLKSRIGDVATDDWMAEPEEGEPCDNCGSVWTGTSDG
jgi:hypothetical protein